MKWTKQETCGKPPWKPQMAKAERTLTKEQRRAACLAAKDIGWLDRCMDSLCDDPMTHAMGAPINDFYQDWAGRYTAMLVEHLNDPQQPQQMRQLLIDELMVFCP